MLIEKFEFQSLFKSFLEDKLSSSNVNINTKKEISNDCTNDCSNNYEVKTIFKDDIKDFISLLQKQKFFAFDVETTSLDIFKAKIVGVSFCFDNDKAYYVPLLHEVIFSENKQISVEEFIKLIKDILENDNIKKTGHNLKFDIEIFKNHGVDVLGIVFDSMIASYLLNPDDVSFSLSRVVKKYLGHDCIEYKDVVGKKKNFSEVDIETASKYSAEDAYFSFILYLKLNDELTKKDLLKVFYEIDLPLLNVLATMELNGVYIDTQQLRKSSMFFAKELEILEQEIYELAGSTFNINSPKQLSYILFEKLNISTAGLKKTQFGFSTDVNTLEKLKNIHPIAEKLLKYRGIFKLKSTYLDALPEFVSSKTNRLHTRYNQAGTGTGRLSSSDPNLQNIPIKTLEGRKIRSAFLAPSEKVIISADYSQVELRVLAHMSKDKTLIEAFNKGEDIHTKTAKFIFELKATDTPTQEQRRFAKVINFGLIYGMSAYGLSNELSISVQTAKKYIDGFFNKYFGVKEYFDKLLKDVESLGYVSTMFGRKRFVSSLFSDNKNKGYLNRMAINAPIQGTAADIIKLAMISIHNEIIDRNLKLKMILQIHDELVFECDESFKDEAISFIKTQMESITLLDVPLKVDVGSGASWEDAH
ncbi:MAG: DNA polymerase I [Bdellovibrionota bacterium]